MSLVIHSEADHYEETVPEARKQQFENRDRLVSSITLQDEFQVSDQLALTGGLRYDHYDDIGEKLSPRIAAVYRINKHRGARRRHILKAQYARAFRPPTFLEIYAMDDPGKNASDIESETIDTYELGYVYRDMSTVGRITIFYSDIEARVGEIGRNLRRFHSKGVEVELERALIPDVLKLDGNFSYADTEDQDTGDAIPEAANWLANIGLIYQPCQMLSLGLQYRYVGDREDKPENGGNTGQYHTVDITASLFRLGIRNLTLRGGVKNLFEDDMRYVSQTGGNDYIENDFSHAEVSHPSRWWWIEISYEF